MAVKTISQLEKKTTLTGTEWVPVFNAEGEAGKASLSTLATQFGSVPQDTLNSITTARLTKEIVGAYPEFSTEEYYPQGDLIVYNGKLYQALLDHAIGTSWSLTSWEEVSLMSKALTLAKFLNVEVYDYTKAYNEGDKFIYNSHLCKATQPIISGATLTEGVNFTITSPLKEQADDEYIRTVASMSASTLWQDLEGVTRYTSGGVTTDTFNGNTEITTLLACSVTGTTLKDCFKGATVLKGSKCYLIKDGITDLSGMFEEAGSPGGMLKYLNTSVVTTMQGMFKNSTSKEAFLPSIPVLPGGTACVTTDMFTGATYLTDIEFPHKSRIKLNANTSSFYTNGSIFSSVDFSPCTSLSGTSLRNIINALGTFKLSGTVRYLENIVDSNNQVNMQFIPTLTLSTSQKTLLDNYYSQVYGISLDTVRSHWTGLITSKNWVLA